MSFLKMHENEVETDLTLVQQLLGRQFPQWAHLPLERIPSAGTDNAIFRLGHEMSVRLPRIDWAVGQIAKEFEWLPRLTPYLPLPIPVPVAKGEPDAGYPWPWSIYRWLKGENAALSQLADPAETAIQLAQFLIALQQVDTSNGLPAADYNQRGLPLQPRDAQTRRAVAQMSGLIDTDKALAVWEAALQAPDWQGEPVWFHGDLLVGNLLFNQGKLAAVIDFSGLAVGDPACDLMIAWSLFAGESRELFRQTLGVDEATWARGRGQALSQAVVFVPYYLHSNPVGVQYALQMLKELLK